MYCYQLDCYERAIREPNQQHDSAVINCYVHLCLEQAKQAHNIRQANQIYQRMIGTFEEIICDDLLSKKWRQHSYRVFKQVKPILFEIMSTKRYQKLSKKFDYLADYFLHNRDANTPVSSAKQPK